MTTPFEYPPTPHVRRHGPMGYVDYASYRPWLRDEFSFRCIYCLIREQWGRVRGVYDIDHLLPVVNHPSLALEYDNLLYACSTCNASKGKHETPDPLLVLISPNVKVGEDGILYAAAPEAAHPIKLLGLNEKPVVEFRLLWIGIVALAAKGAPDLCRRLMGFPDDLPDLQSLKPPGGNNRQDGVQSSYFAQRRSGRLPESY